MPAPTTFTAVWRVQCKRLSMTDDTLYYLDFAAGTPKSVANELATELRQRNFKDVRVVLVESIP